MASDLQRCPQRAVGPGEWQAGFGRRARTVRACCNASMPLDIALVEVTQRGTNSRYTTRTGLGHGLWRWQRARPAVRGEPTTDAGRGRPVRRSRADVVGEQLSDELRSSYAARRRMSHHRRDPRARCPLGGRTDDGAVLRG